MAVTKFSTKPKPVPQNNDNDEKTTPGQIIYGIVSILIGISVGSSQGAIAGILAALFWPFILIGAFLMGLFGGKL